MEELEVLANSRTHAQERELAANALRPTATRALGWPLLILAIVLVPPIPFGVLYFLGLDGGHPPAIFFLIAYVFLLAPIGAPIGIWASAAAFRTHSAYQGRALLLMLVFIAGTIAAWAWVRSYLRTGTLIVY